jgi:hypothetical protein
LKARRLPTHAPAPSLSCPCPSPLDSHWVAKFKDSFLKSHPGLFLLLLTAGIIGSGPGAKAQAPTSATTLNDLYQQSSVSLAIPRNDQPNQLEATQVIETDEGIALNSLLNLRPWTLTLGVGPGWSYNSNIFAEPTAVADQIFMTQGALKFNYGAPDTKLQSALNYVGSYNEYLEHSQYSGLSNNLSMTANWRPTDRTSFSSSLSFVNGAGSSLGSGVQNQTATLSGNLGALYVIGEKASAGCLLVYQNTTQEIGGAYQNENASAYIDYRFAPKLRLGLSVGGGTQNLGGTSENDADVGVRFDFVPTSKLSFNGQIGWENRSISTGGSSGYPKLRFDCQYQPFDGTLLTLSAYNSVYADFWTNTLAVAQQTGFTLSLTQRLIQRITLTLNAGYETGTVSWNSSGSQSAKEDNAIFGASVGWDLYVRTYQVDFSVFSHYLSSQTTEQAAKSSYDQVISGVEITMTF